MLRRQNRFHGLSSLNPVYRHGKTARSPMLALKFLANERRHDYRVAVVVSRKVNKSAVVRNRLRRRIYEQVRLLSPPIAVPYDLVFTVFSEQLLELKSAELNQLIGELLKQAGVSRRA